MFRTLGLFCDLKCLQKFTHSLFLVVYDIIFIDEQSCYVWNVYSVRDYIFPGHYSVMHRTGCQTMNAHKVVYKPVISKQWFHGEHTIGNMKLRFPGTKWLHKCVCTAILFIAGLLNIFDFEYHIPSLTLYCSQMLSMTLRENMGFLSNDNCLRSSWICISFKVCSERRYCLVWYGLVWYILFSGVHYKQYIPQPLDGRWSYLNMYVSELVQAKGKGLFAYPTPGHYLNQYWIIVNSTPRNKLLYNYTENEKHIFDE